MTTMKASELIVALQEAIDSVGDGPVFVHNYDFGMQDIEGVGIEKRWRFRVGRSERTDELVLTVEQIATMVAYPRQEV